jgi:TetR/AcrR family transcriptional regulator, cholesterol catabolism regulator
MRPGSRGEIRREQILDVSEEFFAERGFDDTNLDLVANRLGLKRQAIYYYFRSKDDILIELVERAGGALHSAVMPTFASDLDPPEKLARVLVNHVEHVLGNAVAFRVQFSEVRRMAPESIAKVRKDEQVYVKHVAGVIESGQRSGDFAAGPPVPMALMILGMCNATLEWYQPGRRMSVADVASLAVSTVMNGLLIRSPS